jgi:predicted nucleotidyltransferase
VPNCAGRRQRISPSLNVSSFHPHCFTLARKRPLSNNTIFAEIISHASIYVMKMFSGEPIVVNINVSKDQIADFCRRHHIRELSFFGSVIRADFRLDSDVDVLVDFEEGHTPGFIRLAEMEMELSSLLGGRVVDLRTPQDLSRYFRDDVLASAEVQYVQR